LIGAGFAPVTNELIAPLESKKVVRRSRQSNGTAKEFNLNSEKESNDANRNPVAPKDLRDATGLTIGTALGISIGVTVGILTNNLALWLSLGISLGVGLGMAFDETKKRRGKPED
jgi:hypothetical protein